MESMESWKRTLEVYPALQAYLEAWNQHDAKGVAAAFAEGGTYQDSATGGHQLSGKAIEDMADILFEAFPNLNFEPLHISEAGENGAVLQWIMRGTNSNSFAGLPPTGKSIAVPGIDIVKFQDGKIESLRGYFDRQEYLQQLGLDVIVQPKAFGDISFGTSARVPASADLPGALAFTWIDLRPEDDREHFFSYGRQVSQDMKNMDGFLGFWTAGTENRVITLTAWADVDAVKQINHSKAHQESVRSFFSSFGSVSGTSVWVPHHFNVTWTRCEACGKMNDPERTLGQCTCGAKLPDPVPYL